MGQAAETPGLWVQKDGQDVCLYQPSPLQQRFHASTAPNCLMEGSRGGGKSYAMRFDAYMRCLRIENFSALIIRRQMPELEKSHLKFVARECLKMGGDSVAVFLRGKSRVEFPSTGAVLQFGHAEDDRAVEKYLSSEWGAIYFDELVTFNLREFLLISASARTTEDAGYTAIVRGGTNPVGRGAGWVKRYFLTKNPSYEEAPDYCPDEWESIHMDMDDLVDEHGKSIVNVSDYEKRIMALPNEALRRAYRHGEWITEGAAFDEWRETKDGRPWHVIEELPRIKGVPITKVPWVQIVRSLDWGYAEAGNPGLCKWYACLPDHTAIAFKEYYFKKTLPADVAAEIKRRSEGMKVRYTVADPAVFREHVGESIAETFARAGVPLIDGDNEREAGWVRYHAWLRETVDDGTGARPRLQHYRSPADPESCLNSARTIPEMVVDPKNTADIETRGVEDEAVDCDRYFVMSRPAPSREPVARPNEGVQEILNLIAKRRRSQLRIGTEAVRRVA